MRRAADPAARELRDALGDAFALALDRSDGLDREQHPSEFAVASYLERRLHGAEQDAFEQHVAMCPQCAEELVLARRSGVGREPRDARRPWRMAAGLAVALGGLIAALLAARAFGGRIEAALIARLQAAFGGRAAVEDLSLA